MADETKSDLTPEQMAARIAELEGQLSQGWQHQLQSLRKGRRLGIWSWKLRVTSSENSVTRKAQSSGRERIFEEKEFLRGINIVTRVRSTQGAPRRSFIEACLLTLSGHSEDPYSRFRPRR
jgi:hypothetical protein